MPSIFLVNPIRGRKAKRGKNMAKKSLRGRRRNAKGQLLPMGRSAPKRPRARRNPLVMDHGGSRGLSKIKTKRNPVRGHRRSVMPRRRARRNPIERALGGSGFWGSVMTGALVFPVAALLGDMAYGYMPLPSSMQTGLMRPVGKLAVAALLGLGAKYALPRNLAVFAAAGLIGGVVYDSAKSYMIKSFPTLPLSGVDGLSFAESAGAADPSYLGYAAPEYMGDVGTYMDHAGMHEYLNNEAA